MERREMLELWWSQWDLSPPGKLRDKALADLERRLDDLAARPPAPKVCPECECVHPPHGNTLCVLGKYEFYQQSGGRLPYEAWYKTNYAVKEGRVPLGAVRAVSPEDGREVEMDRE